MNWTCHYCNPTISAFLYQISIVDCLPFRYCKHGSTASFIVMFKPNHFACNHIYHSELVFCSVLSMPNGDFIWSPIIVIVSPSFHFVSAKSCSVFCELNVCICVVVCFTWPGQLSLYWFSFSNGVLRFLAQVYIFSFQFTVPVYSCNNCNESSLLLSAFRFSLMLNRSAFSIIIFIKGS